MRQYIVNLTNNLIGKNGYEELYHQYDDLRLFLELVKLDLETGDVGAMSPAKLGQIMCSFEVGDVITSKSELLGHVRFAGTCEQMLRELVSIYLAYVIKERLAGFNHTGIPQRKSLEETYMFESPENHSDIILYEK